MARDYALTVRKMIRAWQPDLHEQYAGAPGRRALGCGYGHRGKDGQRSATWIGVAGLLLVAGYAVAGTLQVLLWNPLAAVPGATVAEIHAVMDGANETLAAPAVLAWAAIGISLSAVVLIAAMRRSISGETAAALDLLLLVLAAPSHWMASFPAGMGLADAFAISGGDYAPWGKVLYTVSAVSLAGLLAGVVRRERTQRAQSA